MMRAERLRILLLANPEAAHTVKWATGLACRGLDVRVVSLPAPRAGLEEQYPGVQLEGGGVPSWTTLREAGSLAKILYLRAVSRVRAAVERHAPDVVHAHYISSYGLLGAIAGVHPYVISVWGSDIYEFPERSPVHRALIRFALRRADRVCATSHVMARHTAQFTEKPIDVIAFGVDLRRFVPGRERGPFAEDDIVVGTVKTLHPKYGIDTLIEAFALVRARHPALPLKLLIVGGGPQASELRRLVARRGLSSVTTFTGPVPSTEVPRYHRQLDVFVALSNPTESFGVAVVEAGACGRPVIVSDVGGLPEVVDDGTTGIIVPWNRPEAAAGAIERLVLDPELRARMGAAGRERVARHYDLERNLDQMIGLYRETASAYGRSGAGHGG
ncbi:MAG TPA: glycosyltransferase [Longimicrobiales bacterium]|nr:glycosyltransferase [Longimicrobiales bacterium]